MVYQICFFCALYRGIIYQNYFVLLSEKTYLKGVPDNVNCIFNLTCVISVKLFLLSCFFFRSLSRSLSVFSPLAYTALHSVFKYLSLPLNAKTMISCGKCYYYYKTKRKKRVAPLCYSNIINSSLLPFYLPDIWFTKTLPKLSIYNYEV